VVLQHFKSFVMVFAVVGVGISPSRGVATATDPHGGEDPDESAEAPRAASATAASRTSQPQSAGCPAGMVRVEGEYCPEVEQVCKRFMDPPPYQTLRCAEYETTPTCKKERVHLSFCMDRDEHTKAGNDLADVDVSFIDAKATCASEGKALCKEDQWQFACEGEEMRPYPYGFARDSSACNIDQTNLGSPGRGLRDLRAVNSAFERCMSPFGVHNMTGNVDEWVEGQARKSTLHGGWWLPGRNRCRATTYEHGPEYFGKQVGFRCCAS
jgi:formylglycine-generating enzyme